MITVSEPKIVELTLEQRIAHTDDPAIKLQLAKQLIEETRQDLFVNSEQWEESVNKQVPKILASLELSPLHYKVRVFFHLANEKEWRTCDGTIVEIHYYGHGRDKDTKLFREGLKSALQWVPKLQRTNALEVREVMVKRKADLRFNWQKTKIGNREVAFDLLPKSRMSTKMQTELTVTKMHKETGIRATVIGDESDRQSLEIQCWIILSRKVAEFYEGIVSE